MATESSRIRNQSQVNITAAQAIVAGELWQLPDGRVGRKQGAGAAVGDIVVFETGDVWTVPKATGVTFLDGGQVWWDHSANAATYKKVNDRDYFLGLSYGGAASADTTAAVSFNLQPRHDIDLSRDPFTTAIVGTQALGGLGLYRRGGAMHFVLDSTSEAQKVDALSVDGFAPGANAIIEGAFRVISDGSGTTPDISLGIASATHSSDADAIAESAFIHLNGNSVNVYAENDDGTHETGATDTTIDYTEGSTVACRVEFWIDLRDLTSVKFYVNGARVLSGTTFNLSSAAGPWFLLVHVEKTASTDTYELAVDRLTARFSEQ